MGAYHKWYRGDRFGWSVIDFVSFDSCRWSLDSVHDPMVELVSWTGPTGQQFSSMPARFVDDRGRVLPQTTRMPREHSEAAAFDIFSRLIEVLFEGRVYPHVNAIRIVVVSFLSFLAFEPCLASHRAV